MIGRHLDKGTFSGNPFYVFGAQPRREARIRSYVRRQHLAGCTLDEILTNRFIDRLGGRGLFWRALVSPRAIHDLADDALQEARLLHTLVRESSPFPGSERDAK